MLLDGKLSPGPLLLNGTVQGRLGFPLKTWTQVGPDGKKKALAKLVVRLGGVVGKVRLSFFLFNFTFFFFPCIISPSSHITVLMCSRRPSPSRLSSTWSWT